MKGEWGLVFNGYRLFFRGDEKVLEIVVMVVHLVNVINTIEFYT